MTNLLPQSKYRVMVCGRGVCVERSAALHLETHLRALLAQHGLDQPDHPQTTRCQLVNCLGVCHSGPILMVHPDGVLYQQVNEAKLRRIVEEHLLQDKPVKELQTRLAPIKPRREIR